MPNYNYIKGVKAERQLVNLYRSANWTAARSAGSKSPVDVWCYNPHTNHLIMFQVKTSSKSFPKSRVNYKKHFSRKGIIEFYTLSYHKGFHPKAGEVY